MRRFLIITIALVLCLLIVLQAQDDRRLSYGALLTSAKIYLGQKQKDYQAAMEKLTIAIEKDDFPVEAYYWLGLINSEKAQYDEMLANFSKFKELCAKAEEENEKKLRNRCHKDDMDEQIDIIILADWRTNFSEGVRDLKLADSLREVAKEIPEDSARQVMETGVEKFYSNAMEDFTVCTKLSQATDMEELDTLQYKAWTNLAMVKSRLGDMEGAVETYRQSYEMNPDDPAMLPDLANSLYKLGRYGEAAEYYELMAEKDSLNAGWALTYAAICYQNTKERDKLKTTFDRILEVSPEDAQIHYQRGIFYIQEATSAELQDSISLLDSLADASPNDESLAQAKEDILQYRLSLYQRAMPDFRAAALTDSTDVDYQYWYGTSVYFSDDLEKAMEIYERCVELDENHKDCWCGLELIYARLKMQDKYDEAKAKCEE